MKMKSFILLICAICTIRFTIAQIPYPGDPPGKAMITASYYQQAILENNVIKIIFLNDGKKISIKSFEDKITHEQLNLASESLFELTLQDGDRITSNDFSIINLPVESDIPKDADATTYANRLPGKKYEADFENQKSGLSIHWVATLRDGSNYIRQIFTFTAKDSVKVSKISLIKIPKTIDVRIEGTVDGSPLVHNNMFFALEHPMSQVDRNKFYTTVFLPRLASINSANSFTTSAVWGVTPINQLRRGFLYYLEMERAYPYHQMLHYNSWYDLSWEDRTLNDSLCLDRIKVYTDSLINKRNVRMNAFLFDDGWDDYKTLWQFNSGFPDGFNKLKKACEASHAGIGVWMSPWGGYDIRKPQRIAYGIKQIPPFETNENGFTLSGPVYYYRFKEVAGNFIKKYGISLFKFDGVGLGNEVSGASIAYQRDIEAFLKLTSELREIKSDIYLSLTIGTWPSVYFLKYGDATWRSGEDTGLQGKGSRRQQWMNYRDGEAYKNVVMRAPLYPLNSLMYHGICIGNTGIPGTLEINDKEISDEIWSFFGSGTSLQEMYINPHKLNAANWDCLAKAINWAKENEKAMVDVHWIGGDPSKEQVYGYASWSPQKAYLTLRNPSEQTKTFDVIVARVFELPDNAINKYKFFDARTDNRNQPLAQGKSFSVVLKPFEVKVLDAVPVK
jgi:hypothetical protein